MRSRILQSSVVFVLVLSACGATGDSTTTIESSTTTTGVATTREPADSTTTESPTTTVTTEPVGTVIEVTVSGSEVTGGGRIAVALGESVTLVVTADVADEVHVHGYDLMLDLEAGVPGELTFVADVPGVFEIELEREGLGLADLEVGG